MTILKKYLVGFLGFGVRLAVLSFSCATAPSFLISRKESARVRARSATHDGVTQLIVPLLV